MRKHHKQKVVELIKRMNEVLILLITEEIQIEAAMAQIDDLNAAITSLQSQVTALQALPAPVPAPDLAPATSAVQAAADAIGVVVKNQTPTV